jgi:predicted dehydrogenase
MRFALLGKHPDGLEMASALVATGRHELAVYTVPVPEGTLRRFGPAARLVPDLEEVLANPAVDVVIVAGTAANRPEQLRRSLQSERHVLCVHPADGAPDAAYEAGMIQVDTRKVLLPLLPDLFHPGVTRLAELLREDGILGPLRLIEWEQAAPGSVLLEGGVPGFQPGLPGWDVLRRLGGEVAEVLAFAEDEEVTADRPLLLAGRFERGGLLRMALLPGQRQACWRLVVTGELGRAELLFPLGRPGPAFLSWREPSGERREEAWDITDPWPLLVDVFETALAGGERAPAAREQKAVLSTQYSGLSTQPSPPPPPLSPERRLPLPLLTWQDEVRCLELDAAARRSVERRRASTLEYQVASEEVGFKGTMTLVGCGLLWLILLLAILSVWVPKLGWAVGPLLVVFLALQVLLYVARRGKEQETALKGPEAPAPRPPGPGGGPPA